MVLSFAPWRSYSIGTSSGKSSGVFFSAPSLANLSLSSLPWFPAWPFTHLKRVGAVRRLRRYAAVLKRSAFFIPIHPLFSQSLRCFVRPSITYLESVIIIRGHDAGIIVAVFIMAAISPIWLDCFGPGTFMVLLSSLSGLIHIPLPQYAFSLPLLKQAPSV